MVGRFLLPALIALALIIAIVVTAAGEETRAELQYLDEIKSQSEDLSRSGASIREIMPRLREVDRNEFTTVMDSVTADVNVALAFVASEPPVESLVPVWSLYRQAVEAWNSGVEGISTGILQAADQPDDATVANAIGDALADLRTGDRIFDDLRAEVQREEVPEPLTPLVDVALSPAEGGLASLASSYVAAAQASTNNLGLRPGLRISQVLSEPRWQPNVEGQTVVPSTETITFSVVITNVGNVESTPETLTIELTGGELPVRATEEVPVLRPEGQVTVAFDPVEVEPDTPYEVVCELVISGIDSDLTDNSLSVGFIVNTG